MELARYTLRFSTNTFVTHVRSYSLTHSGFSVQLNYTTNWYRSDIKNYNVHSDKREEYLFDKNTSVNMKTLTAKKKNINT